MHEVRLELVLLIKALQEFPNVPFANAEILVVRLAGPLVGGHGRAEAETQPRERENGGDLLFQQGEFFMETAQELREGSDGIALGEHRVGARDGGLGGEPGTHGIAEVDDTADAPVAVAAAGRRVLDAVGQHVVVVGVSVHDLGAQVREQGPQPLLAGSHPAPEQGSAIFSPHASDVFFEDGRRRAQIPVKTALRRRMLEVGEGGIQAGEDAPPGAQQLRPLRAHPGDRHSGQVGDQTQRVAQAMLLCFREGGAPEVWDDLRKRDARRGAIPAITRVPGSAVSLRPAATEVVQKGVLHLQRRLGLGGIRDFQNEGVAGACHAAAESPSGTRPIPGHPQQKILVPLTGELRCASLDAVAHKGQRFGFPGSELGTIHAEKVVGIRWWT